MGVKSLISYGFLVLPVAVTLGVLFGLQSYRVSRGFAPPFVSNKISHKQYCQLSYGISPETTGLQYTREFLPIIVSLLAEPTTGKLCRPSHLPIAWCLASMTLLGGQVSRLFLDFHLFGLGCDPPARVFCVVGLHRHLVSLNLRGLTAFGEDCVSPLPTNHCPFLRC